MFHIRSFLWLMPFASFIGGYLIVASLHRQPALQAPSIIGKTLDQAVLILSETNLNLRIVGQKEEAQLPEGTVLTQTPAAGSTIKEQQALYVTTAKKPIPLAMPNLIAKTQAQAQAELEALSLQPKIYHIASDQPIQTIIAQFPDAGESTHAQEIILYSATDAQKPLIMPNLKQRSLDEVISFLDLNGITPAISHVPTTPDHQCTNCIIVDQRPLAGTIFKRAKEKPLQVQLQVAEH